MTAQRLAIIIALLLLPACFDSDERPDELEAGRMCDATGCPCVGGSCAEGLVCGLAEVCQVCEPGEPGCACDRGMCDVGQCYSGEDDRWPWSLCYPADPVSCRLKPCPGDAYCTDSGICAWLD